jgi:Zn-dependent protease
MSSEYRGPGNVENYTADVGTEQRQAAEKGHTGEGKKRAGWLGIGGAIAAIGSVLLKIPALGFLFKFGLAGFTAFVTAFFYAAIFGWPFAVGLVISIFIHEMGHAVVMRLKGIPVGGMVFIPFLGAWVSMRQMPKNARDEAEVGIAGPIAGALAASFCLWMATQPHALGIWAPLAYFGFFINLFNLIPIVPFDGGRVLAAIDRRIWVLGFLGLLGVQIWEWMQGNTSFWLLFFVLMAATQLWSRGFTANTPEEREYYNVPLGTRIVMTLLYFGLAAALFLGMSISHSILPL